MISLILTNWKYVVMALLLALLGVQQVRINNAQNATMKVQQSFDHHLAQDAEAAFKAEREARELEEDREQKKQDIIDAAEARVELAKAAADDSNRAATSLRDRLAKYVAAAREAAKNSGAPIPSNGQQGDDPIGVLANLYAKSDDRAGQVSVYADALKSAGQACEDSYNALTK